MEKVKFRCPSCSKALAIDAKHAGKAVACPGCSTRVKIPSPTTGSSADVQPTPATPQVTPKNPFADSPADTSSDDPLGLGDLGNLPASSDLPSVAPLPTNTYAPQTPEPVATQTPQSPTASKPALGKSIGGLVVAAVVAGVFSIIWLIVMAITGYELGVLAWAMGGAVGFAAGVIARNPSPVYCGLTAGVAVMGVLGAKLIVVAGLMVASWGVGMMDDFVDMFAGGDKYHQAMSDQMLADGAFEGLEKQYVEIQVASFFSGSEDAYEEMTEEMYGVSTDVNKRVREELETKTPEQKEELLAAARERHPEWIEDNNQYLAIVEVMSREDGALSDELKAHANSELAQINGEWDEDYFDSVAPNDIKQRRVELRTLAAERLSSMSEEERDQAVRDVLQRNLEWQTVYLDAYTAVVEQMKNEGKLPASLKEHAEAMLDAQFNDEYADYYDDTDYEVIAERDTELRKLANERLVTMDQAARDTLIASTKAKYPDWYLEESSTEDAQEEMQEALDELGTDGTFLGSLAAVFGLFDLLWIFLGASTAYGTAHKYGAEAA